MRTAACALVTLFLVSLMPEAWAQMGPAPSEDVDPETALGFVIIVAAAIGYWLWKRRRRNATLAQVARQQPMQAPVLPPPPQQYRTQEVTPSGPAASWPEARGTTGSVFISYRRGDAGDVVGRIYDRLVDRFGKQYVFKDVDSIPLGVDFRKHLSDSVGQCKVFLAIISRGWVQQADGERRIEQGNDFVRIEIEAALHRNIPVIPVLVQGASLPAENELPPSLRELAYRNATPVRADPDFQADIARLMDGIAYHLR